MSLKDRLGALVAWGASHTHIEDGDAAETHEQAGGSLEANFEQRGQAALLRDFGECGVDRLVMTDSTLRIELSRAGAGAHLAVFHGDTPTVAEDVVIPGAAVPVGSEPLFCPDPESRVTDLALSLIHI